MSFFIRYQKCCFRSWYIFVPPEWIGLRTHHIWQKTSIGMSSPDLSVVILASNTCILLITQINSVHLCDHISYLTQPFQFLTLHFILYLATFIWQSLHYYFSGLVTIPFFISLISSLMSSSRAGAGLENSCVTIHFKHEVMAQGIHVCSLLIALLRTSLASLVLTPLKAFPCNGSRIICVLTS